MVEVGCVLAVVFATSARTEKMVALSRWRCGGALQRLVVTEQWLPAWCALVEKGSGWALQVMRRGGWRRDWWLGWRRRLPW